MPVNRVFFILKAKFFRNLDKMYMRDRSIRPFPCSLKDVGAASLQYNRTWLHTESEYGRRRDCMGRYLKSGLSMRLFFCAHEGGHGLVKT